MKLLFDNGPDLIVWAEDEKLILKIGEARYELEGEDLFNFTSYIKSHQKRILEERERKQTFLEKLKILWRPIA